MGNTTSKPALPSESRAAQPRLYHLDNLRTSLTALVVFHHASVPYGGLGSWPYISRFHAPSTSPTLMAFNALNQTFFMGTFFYMSGLMSSTSLRRKGRKEFLKTKWIKLGVPVAIWTFFGPALQKWILGGGWQLDWRAIRGVKGSMWYPATLLAFDSMYAFMPSAKVEMSLLPAMALNIAITFLARLWWPTGRALAPLNLQLGYAPQYIMAYYIGTRSKPSDITPTQRNVLLCASVLAAVGMWRDPSSLSGGIAVGALSYTVWNETTGCVLGSSILGGFRKWCTEDWGFARYSYAAFLVHQPLCIAIQSALDGWEANGVVKTVIVGSVSVVGSWVLGWGMSLLPVVGGIVT